MSTTYYAIFHCLVTCCADMFIGTNPASRSNPAWRQVYRALEHGAAKQACEQASVLREFPETVYDFATRFAEMQTKRHSADYDPDGIFYKSSVQQDVADTEDVIKRFQTVAIADRRAFAAFVLLKTRKR